MFARGKVRQARRFVGGKVSRQALAVCLFNASITADKEQLNGLLEVVACCLRPHSSKVRAIYEHFNAFSTKQDCALR